MNRYPWIDEYLISKPGVTKDYKVEWEWLRYKVGDKLFAIILHPSDKYDPMYANKDLISLKCDPILAELLRKEYDEVMPGFYCDKRIYNSIDLGGTIPDDRLKLMIDESYGMAFGKLTKKLQKEILADNK